MLKWKQVTPLFIQQIFLKVYSVLCIILGSDNKIVNKRHMYAFERERERELERV
jgi:hypothetical protein